MRNITKGPEPKSLVEFRLTENPRYEDIPDKDALREALHKEQKGICCYCMGRILPTHNGMKIEHWLCQKAHDDQALKYHNNLLGACLGGQGQPYSKQHCDTRKGERLISRNPAEPSHRVEETIRYLSDGTIESSDVAFDRELNEILNLNLPLLRGNRKAVVTSLQQTFVRKGNLSTIALDNLIRKWNGEHVGELQAYAGAAVYWLRKRRARE